MIFNVMFEQDESIGINDDLDEIESRDPDEMSGTMVGPEDTEIEFESAAMATASMNRTWATIMEATGMYELRQMNRYGRIIYEAGDIKGKIDSMTKAIKDFVKSVGQFIIDTINKLKSVIAGDKNFFSNYGSDIEKGYAILTKDDESLPNPAYKYNYDKLERCTIRLTSTKAYEMESIRYDVTMKDDENSSGANLKCYNVVTDSDVSEIPGGNLGSAIKDYIRESSDKETIPIKSYDVATIKKMMGKEDIISKLKSWWKEFKKKSDTAIREANKAATEDSKGSSNEKVDKAYRVSIIGNYKKQLTANHTAMVAVISSYYEFLNICRGISHLCVKAYKKNEKENKKKEKESKKSQNASAIYRGLGYLSDVPVI